MPQILQKKCSAIIVLNLYEVKYSFPFIIDKDSLDTIAILAFFLLQIEQLHCLIISRSLLTSNSTAPQ
jgi:hypothetical protein